MNPRGAAPDSPEARLRDALARAAAGAPCCVWPSCSDEIEDDRPLFRIAFLGPEWADRKPEELRAGMAEHLRHWGRTRRHYRNALAFAEPSGEALRAALAKPAAAALETIYTKLWLPRAPAEISGAPEFEEISVKGGAGERGDRGALAAFYDSLGTRISRELAPAELERALGLGQKDCSGIFRALFPAREVARWFFGFLGLPRFLSPDPIERCVRAGVEAGDFGLLLPSAPRLLALDEFQPREADRVIFGESAEAWRGFDHPGAYLIWRGALEHAGR